MGAYTTYKDKKIKIWKAENLELKEFVNIYPEFENICQSWKIWQEEQ